MSRSVVIKSSTRTVKKPLSNRGKKLCEDGLECKYKHEYQHTMEFDHEDMKQLVPFSGKARKLGSSKPKSSIRVSGEAGVMSGGVRRLGGVAESSRLVTAGATTSTTIAGREHGFITEEELMALDEQRQLELALRLSRSSS